MLINWLRGQSKLMPPPVLPEHKLFSEPFVVERENNSLIILPTERIYNIEINISKTTLSTLSYQTSNLTQRLGKYYTKLI